MEKRKNVAVFFGGRSGEHVVSLRSAASIMEAIDKERYCVIPVGITREGTWVAGEEAWQNLWEQRTLENSPKAALVADPLSPGLLIETMGSPHAWTFQPIDLAFPVMHGTYGEDGAIQGLLEMAGVPYVGSGVLASASAMDKVVMKILFKEQNLPVGPFIHFYRADWLEQKKKWQETAQRCVGYPCFVKPANLGSSVGISKAKNREELSVAVEEALLYDDKVVLEAHISGREIECSVLGNLEPTASCPGEIIPCNEFYDYKAKYIDDKSELIIPVKLGEELEQKVRELSCVAFKAVEASGLARVDFFVDTESGEVVINEINTIPGFTSISMYPKLWEASGIDYRELVNRLLVLAEERFQRRRTLRVLPPE